MQSRKKEKEIRLMFTDIFGDLSTYLHAAQRLSRTHFIQAYFRIFKIFIREFDEFKLEKLKIS